MGEITDPGIFFRVDSFPLTHTETSVFQKRCCYFDEKYWSSYFMKFEDQAIVPNGIKSLFYVNQNHTGRSPTSFVLFDDIDQPFNLMHCGVAFTEAELLRVDYRIFGQIIAQFAVDESLKDFSNRAEKAYWSVACSTFRVAGIFTKRTLYWNTFIFYSNFSQSPVRVVPTPYKIRVTLLSYLSSLRTDDFYACPLKVCV